VLICKGGVGCFVLVGVDSDSGYVSYKNFIYDFLSLCGGIECCFFRQFCVLLVAIQVPEKNNE